MTSKAKRGGARPGSGRKRIPEAKKAKTVTIKLNPENNRLFQAVPSSKKSWFVNVCMEYYRTHRPDLCQQIMREFAKNNNEPDSD